MDTTIKLKSALDILKKKYENDYANYKSVTVEFQQEKHLYTYTDWGGFTETERYYRMFAIISYTKQVGDLILEGDTKKDYDALTKDLTEELKKIYVDDEYEIAFARIPTYETENFNLNDDVTISFKKKKTKTLVKE